VSGTYDQNTGMINLIYSFSGLSMASVAAHIHSAAVGINGPVIVTLNHPAATSGANNSTYSLPIMEEAGFLAGNTYVNIHNATFPGGEIRAQLSVVPARAIPTLSQWGFATLFLLLSIVGVVAVRKGMWNISTN
ncbi:MAG TPA: IPTL-CTERM sorting domain-containing protein, partial [Saprospiraceae bacterium]|nr:IPTL-CTERM sorting domain-containing protein [Saprospiraceae bacterium]